MNINNDEEGIDFFNRLLERLHQAGFDNRSSHLSLVYVAPGAQHVDHVESQYIGYSTSDASPTPNPIPEQSSPIPADAPTRSLSRCLSPKGEGNKKGQEKGASEMDKEDAIERLRQCIVLLMQEKYGDELLFNQQSHWQAIYRLMVDKGYCSDSDFDGFDVFIHTVMPENVNKLYRKDSVKNISQTDFGKPFIQWRFDPETSKTRKPFDRMVAVAQRFKEILEENGI